MRLAYYSRKILRPVFTCRYYKLIHGCNLQLFRLQKVQNKLLAIGNEERFLTDVVHLGKISSFKKWGAIGITANGSLGTSYTLQALTSLHFVRGFSLLSGILSAFYFL